MAFWTLPAAIVSLVLFFGSLWGVAVIVIRLPADHFLHPHPSNFVRRHPLIHLAIVIVKNAVGMALILAGLTMLVLPGQGLLTILLGISLTDLPFKHRLLLWILERRSIQRSLNWIRRKARKPPLQFPDHARHRREDSAPCGGNVDGSVDPRGKIPSNGARRSPGSPDQE